MILTSKLQKNFAITAILKGHTHSKLKINILIISLKKRRWITIQNIILPCLLFYNPLISQLLQYHIFITHFLIIRFIDLLIKFNPYTPNSKITNLKHIMYSKKKSHYNSPFLTFLSISSKILNRCPTLPLILK